jgi:hypothetical protein
MAPQQRIRAEHWHSAPQTLLLLQNDDSAAELHQLALTVTRGPSAAH